MIKTLNEGSGVSFKMALLIATSISGGSVMKMMGMIASHAGFGGLARAFEILWIALKSMGPTHGSVP